MRLNRLELIRYGRFQDYALDFGSAKNDRPDITVVYGANEAGKSTAFMAWLDFLFGFQGASPYAYRFDRRDLLVGAELETPDGPQTLRRSTATAGSLTDANGHLVADQRMAGWLYGLDREAYRTRFSLNEPILREGGKEIAQAQGDLGQLLHAGASGLSGLSNALVEIEGEIAAFYKKGGRKTVANEGRNRLKQLEAQLRTVRLDPRTYDRLSKDRDDAEAAFAEATRDLADARRALKLREAADQRRDMSRRIYDINAELQTFPKGPSLPTNAVARVAKAAEKNSAADATLASETPKAEAAAARLATLDGDPAGQQVTLHLAALDAAVFGDGEPLLARAQTALADLPKRRLERDGVLARMAAIAAGLAGPDAVPDAVVLPKALLAKLRRVADDVWTAQANLEGERTARQTAEADLGESVDPPEGLDRLEDALQAWRRNPDAHDDAVRAQRTAEATAADLTAGLPPDWRAAAEAGLPEVAEIEAVTEALQLADSDRAAAATREREAAGDAEVACRARDALAGRPDVPLDHEIAESRSRRDAAWTEHRARLDAGTADNFARAMQDDDTARLRHAATTEARLLLAQHAEAAEARRAEHAAKATALGKAEARAQAAAEDVAAMALRLGLPPSAPAKALRQRRDRLAEALRSARLADTARTSAEEAGEARSSRLGALREALVGEGARLTDDCLPPVAERTLNTLRDRKAAADGWLQARRTIDTLKRSETIAADQLATREAALAAALADQWCAGHDALRLLKSLPALEGLADLDEQRVQLERRIATMEEAIAAYQPMAAPLLEVLALPAGAGPTELLPAARKRAGEAEEAVRAIEVEKERLDRAEQAIREARIARAAAEAEIAHVLSGQQGGDPGDATVAVNRLSRRDDLRRSLADGRAAYAAAAGGFDAEALAAEEAERDPVRTDTLRAEVDEADLRKEELRDARSAAKATLDAALAGEGGVAPDQERAALVEALRQGGREALVRQLGLLAARSALRRFRQAHRGAMIEATERAFAQITGGRWPRLDIQPQGTTERLIGIRGGEPVAVGAMSTGTQGQLYLALRIAGHAQFVAEHGPLPFVTDDIHETFDDERARAAIELAASMGERGQTILFTHHRHVVDLARATVPSVRLIELA
jgi:chromosome segregation protein